MLTKEEVEHIAELAKLALTEAEKERFQHQLSAILDYAENLQAMDVSNIPPTASVVPVNTVLREDKVRPSTDREKLLANAHAKESGMFRVDVVLEEGD